MNGTCMPDSGWGKKGVAVSALIHGCAVALIFGVSLYCVKHPAQVTTIFLDNEKIAPLPDKPGGDGRKAGSEGKDTRAAKGTLKTMFRKMVKPAPAPTKVAAAVSQYSEVGAPTLPPETVPVETREEGIKGNGEGQGGGGGRGMGAYGSGSGFGGTGVDGMGGGRGSGLAAKRPDVDGYLKHNYQYIRDLIVKHLIYPAMAKKMGWEGKVTISFVITESGKADSLKVVKSSGYSVLDSNVLETIKDVEPFPKPPARASISIPITYNLDRT